MPAVLPLVAVLHLGGLHAYEKALVLGIAFGPFVVVGVVVAVLRRRQVMREQQDRRNAG
jgi:hypothetical protein